MAIQDTDSKFELAKANAVRVLETNVLHASDVIYWLDGASANDEGEMTRIPYPLHVSFSEIPRNVKLLHRSGRTAVWRIPEQPMIHGRASEAARTRPSMPIFNITGEVRDLGERYNPRAFSVSVGAGNGVAVVLYPSLTGTPLPPSGVTQGCLKYAGSEEPVAWGLLELEVTVAPGDALVFHAQADKKGDFRISLQRLPPLPENITQYAAVLRLSANTAVTSEVIADTSDFVAMEIESATVANDFQPELALSIRSGERTRINSFNKTHIAIQAT